MLQVLHLCIVLNSSQSSVPRLAMPLVASHIARNLYVNIGCMEGLKYQTKFTEASWKSGAGHGSPSTSHPGCRLHLDTIDTIVSLPLHHRVSNSFNG